MCPSHDNNTSHAVTQPCDHFRIFEQLTIRSRNTTTSRCDSGPTCRVHFVPTRAVKSTRRACLYHQPRCVPTVSILPATDHPRRRRVRLTASQVVPEFVQNAAHRPTHAPCVLPASSAVAAAFILAFRTGPPGRVRLSCAPRPALLARRSSRSAPFVLHVRRW